MAGDRPSSSKAQEATSTPDLQTQGWLADNVFHPFVNGSGVVQVYDTFAGKSAEPLHVAEAKTGSVDWAVQAISGAAGAIVPYVVAGKIAGGGMRALIGESGAGTTAAKVLTSDGFNQILGAGGYELLKAPNQGETRIGNAVGTMAGFAVFEGGNRLGAATQPLISNTIGRMAVTGLERFGVGAVGGAVSYDTSNLTTSLLTGRPDQANWEGRLNSMATGGFINTALPAVTHGVERVGDLAVKAHSNFKASMVENSVQLNEPKPFVRNLADITEQLRTQRAFITAPEGGSGSPEVSPTGGVVRFKDIHQPTNEPTLADVVRASAPVSEAPLAPATDKVTVPATTDSLIAPAAEKALVVTDPERGSPDKLGATVLDNGINYAIHSKGATGMDLLVFDDPKSTVPDKVLTMFRTGDVWHRFVEDQPAGSGYLYRAHGTYDPAGDGSRFNPTKVLIDPEARAIADDGSHYKNGSDLGYDNTDPKDPKRDLTPSKIDNVGDMPKAIAVKSEFDWKGDQKPNIPMDDAVIYEMNVRGFTGADTSLGDIAGTYRGIIAKIPYLKQLGITTVELMPVMDFYKDGSNKTSPVTGEPLTNAWGYNTRGFKAPEAKYAADGMYGQQVDEFKAMVRELHANGIEVVMDVVFNHTGEGDQHGPTFGFKGLDNNTSYLLKPENPAEYADHTGCGNTVNTNDPVMQKYILDTLKYWTNDMHVDGFRFDLATVFNYDVDGKEKVKTPIMEAMENDPELSKVKLIAEPWSIDQYRLGRYSDKIWAEWNGNFRDVARKFVKSDEGQTATLAKRIAGSPEWFDRLAGRNSVNFITAHDGFTLNDLVSYNEKHNEANGENNRDGSNDNFSWNSGYEGSLEHAPLSDGAKADIEALRSRQVKNLLSLMFLSQGTPMLLYGDEVRRTANGNNNAYNQDKVNMMDPALATQHADALRFTQMMIELRKANDIGSRGADSIVWHGAEPNQAHFNDTDRMIAWEYKPTADGQKPIYSAFNAYWEPIKVTLPAGTKWSRLVDTNLPSGQDIVTPENATPLDYEYIIQPRSGIVLQGEPATGK